MGYIFLSYSNLFILGFQCNFWTIAVFIILFIAALLFLPFKGSFKLSKEVPKNRFDERDTMFSRLEISSKPNLQHAYYQSNPEKLKLDQEWHKKPGLMSEDSTFYSPLTFAAADASFLTIEHLRPFVNGDIKQNREDVEPKLFTEFVSQWSKKLGAISVGICEMKEYHYYSVRGRGADYGKKVTPQHEFGIVFTVEMNEDFLAMGPAGPTLMESAQQYLNSGTIAVQVAQLIRNLGYEARAHIDGNYEVICPLVARDANLGELGRMGLLITPELGPRVRLGVVTTNVPLIPAERKPDYSVHDFCNICKKCANVCPSQAIQKTPITLMDEVERWKIDHEKCFGYWCSSGTDCGRCVAVCPYAHKNNWMHNFVRWGIKNNWLFRRLAVYGDDIFYGKKPKPIPIVQWLKKKSE